MSKREREDAEEQAFFDRVTDFQKRNFKFVQVAAAAVGETNGDMPMPDWPAPDGGWEAEVVRMLEQGYYPNGLVEFQSDKFSPLHHAVVCNHQSMCEILLAHGADVNLSSSFGDYDQTMLHDVQNEAICKLLLDAGAIVNALGASGDSTLMTAAARGDTKVVRMLLAAGADPTIYDTTGTAAAAAHRSGHLSLAKELTAAERSHPKKWVEPASAEPGPGDPGYTEHMVKQITENRARLDRRIKEYPPPSAA